MTILKFDETGVYLFERSFIGFFCIICTKVSLSTFIIGRGIIWSMRFYRQVHDVYCKIRNCSRGIRFTLSQTLTTSDRPLLARFCNRIWTNKSRSLQHVHNFNNLPVLENFPSSGCPVSHLKTRENNAQCICEALERALKHPYK